MRAKHHDSDRPRARRPRTDRQALERELSAAFAQHRIHGSFASLVPPDVEDPATLVALARAVVVR